MIVRMDLVVALVTYDSAAVLAECLAWLRAAADRIGPWRLVVADNASTDRSVALVERLHPDATVVRLPRNLGYAAGVNAAIAAAPGTGPVLVLNPDVRLEPEALARMVRALDRPGTGIVVPRLEGAGRQQRSFRRQSPALRALGQALLGERAGRIPSLGETVTRGGSFARPVTADGATGAAMLISRRCLEAVGPWEESHFLYSEETDFALRARHAGFALLLAPDAGAVHLGGESESSPRLLERAHRQPDAAVPAPARSGRHGRLRRRRGPW
jgi:GT2 family glycosyltransferase